MPRAKKSKKNRKHGRSKRRPWRSGAAREAITAANKVKRINYERKKAGLPPVPADLALAYAADHTIRPRKGA